MKLNVITFLCAMFASLKTILTIPLFRSFHLTFLECVHWRTDFLFIYFFNQKLFYKLNFTCNLCHKVGNVEIHDTPACIHTLLLSVITRTGNPYIQKNLSLPLLRSSSSGGSLSLEGRSKRGLCEPGAIEGRVTVCALKVQDWKEGWDTFLRTRGNNGNCSEQIQWG